MKFEPRAKNVSEEIESIVKDKKLMYIDAIVVWCEMHGMEIEFAGELIRKNSVLKSKVQMEAENLNYLKRSSRLPI